MRKNEFFKIFSSLVLFGLGIYIIREILIIVLNPSNTLEGRLIIGIMIIFPIIFFLISIKVIIDTYFKYKLSNAKQQKIKNIVDMIYKKLPVIILFITWFSCLMIIDYIIITTPMNGKNRKLLLLTLIFWISGFIMLKKLLKRKNK